MATINAGTSRLTINIPKDPSGTPVAAIWNNPVIDANLDYIFTPIVAGDIDGVNYVSGSEGNTKTIKVFAYGASIGSPALLYQFYYGNSSDASFVTRITTISVTV